MITPSLYDTFAGFGEESSTFLITEDFLIIEGWVQNYGKISGRLIWKFSKFLNLVIQQEACGLMTEQTSGLSTWERTSSTMI